MARWARGGMQVAASVGLGLLVLEFSGLVTPAALAAFAENYTPEGAVLAILADFQRASLIGMSGEAFTAPLARNAICKRFSPPGAVICLERDLGVFEEHARQATRYGVVRGIFTNPMKAQAWAEALVATERSASLRRLRMTDQIPPVVPVRRKPSSFSPLADR